MVVRFASLCLMLLVPVACGDDTGGGGSGQGEGGDDPVVTVVGAGGAAQGCTVGDSISCRCRDGGAGAKVCTTNLEGETYFGSCTANGDPC